MKIALITGFDLKSGGVKSHLLALQQSLTALDHCVEICSPDEPIKLYKFLSFLFAFANKDKARIAITAKRLASLVYKINTQTAIKELNLFHAHDILSAAYLSEQGIPLVLTVHGPLSKEIKMADMSSKYFYNFVVEKEKIAYQKAKEIIAVDTGQKNIIVNEYGIDPNKIHVIYNAVDTDYFNPELLDCSGTADYLLVPRRLVAKNGVEVAVKALAAINNQEIELRVAGDGPELNKLLQCANSLGISNRVKFLGNVDKSAMRQLINDARAVLIPSVPVAGVVEATSIAALEAMSMKKTVICSAIGGLDEMIEDGINGYKFAAGSEIELAGLIDKVLANKQDSIEEYARKYVLEKHSLAAWSIAVQEVYYKAVSAQA